jgi:16S rRNA processing protein RimM
MLPGAAPLVAVARIVKPHGLRGEVVLASLTDVEGRLETTAVFLLVSEGVPARELRVESRRFFGGRHVLRFHGIETLTEAEKIRGMTLAVPESEIGPLPENHYFIHQLIGMKVKLKDGRELGTVRKVIMTGGVDVLEIGDHGEHLVPFADGICVEVNLEERLLTIDPPEGLLHLDAN